MFKPNYFANIIKNNLIDGKSSKKRDGILVEYALNTHFISKNVINSYEREGIYLWVSDDLVISVNTINSNNYNGIDLFYSSFNTVTGNLINYNNLKYVF
ncbi:MAG TPA: hypothetical protein ENI29_05660 [bacterium]|nr:hypothetical protein [bacterium]